MCTFLSVGIAASTAVVLAACGGSQPSATGPQPSATHTAAAPTIDPVVSDCITEWNAGLAGTGSIPVTSGVLPTLGVIGVASSPTAYVTTAPAQEGALGEITPQGTCMIFWDKAGSTASTVIVPYSETGAPGGALAWNIIDPQIPGSFLQDSLNDAINRPNAIFDPANNYTLAAYSGATSQTTTSTGSSATATTSTTASATNSSNTTTVTQSYGASSVKSIFLQSPSGNIECEMDFGRVGALSSRVFCESQAKPYYSVTLAPDGKLTICSSSLACIANGPDNQTTVAYGSSVTLGPFRCSSLITGMRCTIGSAGGFVISRSGIQKVSPGHQSTTTATGGGLIGSAPISGGSSTTSSTATATGGGVIGSAPISGG
jgi:hypothetical protein